jgi:hypothetical protein
VRVVTSRAVAPAVDVTLVDPGTSAADAAVGASAAGSASAAATRPTIYTRKDWGADESLRKGTPQYGQVQVGFVHHTVGTNSYSAAQVPAIIRGIYDFHVNGRGWNDVGYSYLVCGTGEVFQGREDDDDATDVWGAHDGFNRGSMSVSLLGYFHPPYSQTPTEPMMESLVRTLAWMSDLRGIDPLDASLYDAFGAVQTNLYGHREVRPTDCPGDLIFARKDEIRWRVAEILSEYRRATSLRRH